MKLDKRQQRRLDQCPTRYRGVYRAALDGEASPRSAIKAMCYACNGFDGDGAGTVADAAKACCDTACPLYAYRPGQRQTAPRATDASAIASEGVKPTLDTP